MADPALAGTAPTAATAPTGLYAQLVGDRAAVLPAVVRHFHVDTDPEAGTGPALGTFRVGHGRRPLARLLAWLLRLPPAGGAVPVRLEVKRTATGETWTRTFGVGRRLVTHQHPTSAGELVERAGPLEVRFAVAADQCGLHFRSTGAALRVGPVRVGLPCAVAPRVAGTATATADGEAMHVRFGVDVPRLGEVLSYDGEMERHG